MVEGHAEARALGVGAAADAVPGFENGNRAAGIEQRARGGEACRAGADNGHIRVRGWR